MKAGRAGTTDRSSTVEAARSQIRKTSLEKQRQVPIQVMVPEPVRRQVALMGAERGENLRTIVLRGLKAIGVDIPSSELVERRGRRRDGREVSNGSSK